MAREETFFVQWLAPSSNKVWAGMHWTKRKKIARDGHLATMVAASEIRPFLKPVRLYFSPQYKDNKKGAGRYDWLNYFATVKPIEDALVSMGILPEDDPDWVIGGTIYAPVPSKENGVLVMIREAS